MGGRLLHSAGQPTKSPRLSVGKRNLQPAPGVFLPPSASAPANRRWLSGTYGPLGRLLAPSSPAVAPAHTPPGVSDRLPFFSSSSSSSRPSGQEKLPESTAHSTCSRPQLQWPGRVSSLYLRDFGACQRWSGSSGWRKKISARIFLPIPTILSRSARFQLLQMKKSSCFLILIDCAPILVHHESLESPIFSWDDLRMRHSARSFPTDRGPVMPIHHLLFNRQFHS